MGRRVVAQQARNLGRVHYAHWKGSCVPTVCPVEVNRRQCDCICLVVYIILRVSAGRDFKYIFKNVNINFLFNQILIFCLSEA